ncbi:hypothetical protein ERO13_D07G176900v2 [Gossypium hirsutum]|nr:hypothetical protein ERO13_D07G176900v2 [Gossypium hirsutum]
MNEVMMAADASSMRGGGATSFASSPSSNLLPNNLPLLTAFLAFALAQFLKLFTNWFKERRWDSKRMIDSGGMPSSHSATVTALAVAIGLQDGMGGPAFAIAVVLACVEYCWWQSLLSIFFSLTFLFPLIDAMAIDLTTSASMSLTMLISMVFSHSSRESLLHFVFLFPFCIQQSHSNSAF